MPSIHRILCPTDFSKNGQFAVEQAADLARRFEAELILTHVVSLSHWPSIYGIARKAVEEHAREAGAAELERLVGELSGQGLRCRSVLESGAPAVRIVDVARREEVDLVVLATHGWIGMAHVLLGSVAERVVRLCACPVLTLKAPEGGEGATEA